MRRWDTKRPISRVRVICVQPRVEKFARVCSYDRAGLGFSDPGPMPRDASAITSDLHALLHAAHIPGPYVLVAHSAGELYAQVYAGRYRSEVAGMVLVDPSFPYQAKAMARAVPNSPKETSDTPILEGSRAKEPHMRARHATKRAKNMRDRRCSGLCCMQEVISLFMYVLAILFPMVPIRSCMGCSGQGV